MPMSPPPTYASGASLAPEDFVGRGGTDLVPSARLWVGQQLSGKCADEIADAAALVTSELVTNALLHAGPDVRLHVEVSPDRVRLDVHDVSRVMLVRPRPGQTGMTGRGLALIDALADRWSVVPTPLGKCVTVELTAASVVSEDADVGNLDDLLASFPDLDGDHIVEPAPRYRVVLGDVPTALLIEAKSHVDSLLREFVLTTRGAVSGMSGQVPAHMGQLVEAVSQEFAEARQTIKRQAVEAATRGEPRTSLVLTLPAEAADAGERYLAALEEADTYARDARLLTLEAPPQHRVFRRWYIRGLVTALRDAAAGKPIQPGPTFEAFVLNEFDQLAILQRATARAARLHRVSAALAMAQAPEDAARILLEEALREFGATRGAVYVVGENAPLTVDSGYSSSLKERLIAAAEAGELLPGPHVASTGDMVWIESKEACDAAYPALRRIESDVASLCAVPLVVGATPMGALRLDFAESHLFDSDERSYLSALATAAAQAVDRALLRRQQAELTERLRVLQRVTASLTRVRDTLGVGDVVVEQATAVVDADLGALCVLEADRRTIRVVRVRSADPDYPANWDTFDINDPLPVAESVREGKVVTSSGVEERDRRWPTMQDKPGRPHTRGGADRLIIVLPLLVGDSAIGALVLSTKRPAIGQKDMELLHSLAEACAQALHRTQAAARLERASRQLTFLAQASLEFGATTDPVDTLRHLGELAVPDLADWCVVHLLQGDELVPIVVMHSDPDKIAIAEDAQRRWPERLDGQGGVPEVMRTGESLFIPRVTAEMLESAPMQDAQHQALLRELGLASVIIAPLKTNGRTFGAITLILSGERHYDRVDLAFVNDLAARTSLALRL